MSAYVSLSLSLSVYVCVCVYYMYVWMRVSKLLASGQISGPEETQAVGSLRVRTCVYVCQYVYVCVYIYI